MRGSHTRSARGRSSAAALVLAIAAVVLLPTAASASPPANPQVTGVSVTPTVVAGGVDFEATATVRNKRETSTKPRTLLFRIFPAAGGSGRSLGTAPIPVLKGKAKAEVSATLQLSSHKKPGDYEIVACRTPKKNTKRCSPKRVRTPLTVVAQQSLEIAPADHGFGIAATGTSSARETLTVTNAGAVPTGSLDVAVTGAAAQFATSADGCTGETLAPGATCTVDLAFAPTTVGPKTASVVVSGAPGGSAVTELTGTGARPAALEITPATRDFGSHATGTTSGSQAFTVTNTGGVDSGAVTTGVSGDTSEFSTGATTCSGRVLAPGASCTADVAFAPTTTGAKAITLEATGTPGGTATADLTGTGITPANLTIAPTLHSFGDTARGSTAGPHTFTVTNTGEAASSAVGTLFSGNDINQFSISNDACAGEILAGGDSCTLDVSFSPPGNGFATTSLLATAMVGGTASATVDGTGVDPANLTITPSAWNFGDAAVGQTSAAKVFKVENTGGVPSGTIGPATLSTPEGNQFTPASNGCTGEVLVPGEDCNYVLQFAPTSNGPKSSMLSFQAAPGGTASASVSGTGVPPAQLTITPNPHDFGNVGTGSSSAAQTFTVANTGGVDSGTLGAATIGAPNGSQFDPVGGSNGCTGEVLSPSETCTYQLRFSPSSTGAKSTTLSFSASPGGTASAAVSGTGVEPAQLTITPDPHNFGNVGLGSSATQTFTVENTGGADSGTLGAASIGPPNASQFNAVGGTNLCTGQVLSPAETCTIDVRFFPSTAGGKSSSLSFSASPGGTATAAISGTGVQPAFLSITPFTRNFGNVQIGTSQDFTYTVTNTGEATSGPIGGISVGHGGGVFALTGTSCAGQTLASGESCPMTIRYSPSAAVSSSDGLGLSASPGGSIAATYQGRGVATAANLQIAIVDGDGTPPPASSYGSSKSFGASAGNDFTQIWIRNTGQADALISNNPVPLTNSGNASFSFPNSPGTSCPIETETGGDETAMTWTNIRIAGGAQCSITWYANLRRIQDPAIWSSSFTLIGSPGGSITGTYSFNNGN